jgi:N-acetylmuramic acid 6-phosphate etherase
MNPDERLLESVDIDRCDAGEIVRIIQAQDYVVVEAVAEASNRIAQAIEAVADRLRHGGRMFYAGAGTSGRIAMLDASELPPTFGVSPDLVQVIMAGGTAALAGAVEGAEDREEDAAEEVGRRVRADDVVVGIAASGTTPFTVAAVRRANMLGALTVGVTTTPDSPLARECDIPIVAATGAEVIMGSTRMKSGTAQKLILNALSTGVMILLGKVYSNLMVEMPATNAKLGRRAVEMVEIVAGVGEAAARLALEKSDGVVKEAVVIAKKGITAAEARELLARHEGNLRRALGS